MQTYTFTVGSVVFEVQAESQSAAMGAANDRLWTDLNSLVVLLGKDKPPFEWVDGSTPNTFIWTLA